MTITPHDQGLHEQLKGSASLVIEEDGALLSFVVVASYAQALFDAIPLVQVIDPRSSDLASALARLGCNASLITGHTSVATAVRALDRLCGLAVIDDLEGIGRRSGEDEFGEFVPLLGASTRKDTASHIWTDRTTLRVEKLDLYGVKVITGAAGAAESFPMPVLKIYARKPPKDGMAQPEHHLPSPIDLQELRDNLHIWVMENAGSINGLYRQSSAHSISPQEALVAPLKVLADPPWVNPTLSGQLQVNLALQERVPPEPIPSVQRVRAALRSIVRQGYRKKLTLKQLMLEMRLQTEGDPGEVSDTASPEWQELRWVGRTLRTERFIDTNAEDQRRWLWGAQTRVLTLEPGFVARVLSEFDAQSVAYVPEVLGPLEFCLLRPCEACPYAGFCTMRSRKEKR